MSRDASGLKSKAFIISLGTLTSRMLGLLRDMAMAALFDRHITDAWTVAFRIPNLFRRLFGEGSLSVSFIPLFIDLQHQDSSEKRARNLMNGFYALMLLFLSIMTIWGLLFMDPLLKFLLDPAYIKDGAKFALTLKMAQIMFGFVFFVVSFSYFTGILQALGEFRWPALAPAIFNVVILVFTFLPMGWFPQRGENLAWGVLVGGLLQSLVLIPVLQNKKFFPKVLWQGLTKDLHLLLVRMLPGILGMGLVQLLTLINLSFASGMGDGVVSAIYWADRMLELPLSLVAVSLSAALLPQLSTLWSRGERQALHELESRQLILNGFWAVPCSFGLYFLTNPIVDVLFFRGEFTEQDLLRTTEVLRIYALSLIVLSVTRILSTLLYASHRVMEASICAVLALLLHLWMAPGWIDRAGLQGLMWSTLISLSVNLLLVVAVIANSMGLPHWKKVLLKHLQFSFLSFGIVLSAFWFETLKNITGSATLGLALAMGLGGGFYFFFGHLFNVHEMFDLKKYLTHKK